MGRKFPRAETWLMETLTLAGTAIECIEMLAVVVVGAGFRCQREPGANHVGHVCQHGRGPLLSVVFDDERKIADLASPHRRTDRTRRRLGADLVAPDRLETDRIEDMNFLDDPFDRWLPVDCFH